MLDKNISSAHSVSLLNVGSCGLHTVHNSFKSGAEAAGWRIGSVLSALYYMFKDSPARCEDYSKISGCAQFPLKFVYHRWLENAAVSGRAIEVWPHIVSFVESALNKKITRPTNSSFDVLVEAVRDKCIIPKLYFFKSIAEHCSFSH